MEQYHKIKTVFKRNPKNKFKTLLDNEYSTPEFNYLKNNEWTFTEKVDGTNIRIMFDGKNIAFGGKTDRAQIPTDLVKKLNTIFLPQTNFFQSIFNQEKACLYGEGYGARIQKGGGNYRKDQSFVLFDIKINDWWLHRQDVEYIAKQLKLDIVPIIGTGTLPEMVKKAEIGFTSAWGDFKAEGIVARPRIELKARDGSRIITKIKYKDFSQEKQNEI